MLRHGKIVLAALLLGAGCGKPAEQAANTPAAATVTQRGPVVVMLGDSLTAGYNLPEESALPAQIESRLRQKGLAATFINAGVSGDTTRGALDRYDWSVKAADPDILVVALGANDYLLGKSAAEARGNLEAILNRAKSDQVEVILLGVRMPRAADSRDEAFAAIYGDLAKAYGAPLYPSLLDGVVGKPELLQQDGVHPTAQGAAIMADKLATFLGPQVAAWTAAHGA